MAVRRTPVLALLVAACLAILASLAPVAEGPVVASSQPYRVHAFDLRDVPYDQLSFTGGVPPKLPPHVPHDELWIPLFRWVDGHLYYRPGEIAINGMLRLDAWLDHGDQAQLDQALVQARKLRRMALERRDAWWLPFRFSIPAELQSPPWFNAMAQGLVLSFFSRLYEATGDPVHRAAADRVFRSFRRLGRAERPWVAYVDGDRYLWLEHYPSRRADHVLNAHLHAIFGLYEYWRMTGSDEARATLKGAITTMRDNARRYRRPGTFSAYCLFHQGSKEKYHEIHIWQLRLLWRISGDGSFRDLAAHLARDVAPDGYVPGRPADP